MSAFRTHLLNEVAYQVTRSTHKSASRLRCSLPLPRVHHLLQRLLHLGGHLESVLERHKRVDGFSFDGMGEPYDRRLDAVFVLRKRTLQLCRADAMP
eukprot:766482-Hanusia_phi.AAC.6